MTETGQEHTRDGEALSNMVEENFPQFPSFVNSHSTDQWLSIELESAGIECPQSMCSDDWSGTWQEANGRAYLHLLQSTAEQMFGVPP